MSPETISLEIGRKLRARRRALGLTLAQVAIKCGVSLQLIHKYETAASVISAPKLWRLSRCLGVPISYFFEDIAD
jgi:transcriptional regulator with XRE-family HTH domain